MSTQATGKSSAGDLFVVDDNPQNLSLLANILRGAGYAVRMANSGKRALAAMTRMPPELVLLDVNMPDMNGYEVCHRLREHPKTRDVPVIFLSALDELSDKMKAFQAGGVDYVTKPFHTEEVLARVGSQMRLAQLRRSLEERNAELAIRNDELLAAREREDRIFTALAHVLPGTRLDAYLLGEKIGAGGFAAVFKGTHVPTGRVVAVKVLRSQLTGERAWDRERLIVEGLSAMRLDHPSAVAILDSGITASGIAYLVMELLEGCSLADELARVGPMTVDRVLEIMIPVCEVLIEAHERGVLHRDVKPANIFLHKTRVKVVDFGIAKLDDAASTTDATTAGRLLGTPAYMAPERLLELSESTASDVYAVGITLYELLTGKTPFEGKLGIGAMLIACVEEAPPSLSASKPGLSESLEAAIMRSLAKAPVDRPTMPDLLRELETAAARPTAASVATTGAASTLR